MQFSKTATETFRKPKQFAKKTQTTFQNRNEIKLTFGEKKGSNLCTKKILLRENSKFLKLKQLNKN